MRAYRVVYVKGSAKNYFSTLHTKNYLFPASREINADLKKINQQKKINHFARIHQDLLLLPEEAENKKSEVILVVIKRNENENAFVISPGGVCRSGVDGEKVAPSVNRCFECKMLNTPD